MHFFLFLFYQILTHFYGKKGVKVEISIDFVVYLNKSVWATRGC